MPPKLRLHNDCGPTYDDQLGNDSYPTGVAKPVNGIPTLPLNSCV